MAKIFPLIGLQKKRPSFLKKLVENVSPTKSKRGEEGTNQRHWEKKKEVMNHRAVKLCSSASYIELKRKFYSVLNNKDTSLKGKEILVIKGYYYTTKVKEFSDLLFPLFFF